MTPLKVLFHLVFAVALQLVVLWYLGTIQWFQPVIPWDDVAFIERGVRNFDSLTRASSFPPHVHAPLGDLQTLLGLILFHLDVRGPYALNFVYIAATTLFIDYYLRVEAKGVRIFATGVVLTFMPFLQGLAQLKSDQKGGLFLCMGLLLLFEPRHRFPRVFAPAACFLLALSSKTTAIYLPAVVFGAIALHGIGCAYLGRRSGTSAPGADAHADRRSVLARYLTLAGCVGLGYAMLIVPSWEYLATYIKYALSDRWDEGATGWSRWLFYTPIGGSGRYWLGHFLLAAAIGALAWRRATWSVPERVGLVSLTIVLAVLYLPLWIDRNQNPDFGTFAYFTVMAGLLYSLRILARQWQGLPRWLTRGPATALVWLLLLAVHDTPLRHIIQDRRVAGAESALTELVDEIHLRKAGDRVAFLFDNLLIPHPNVAIQHYRRYGQILSVERVDEFERIPSVLLEVDFAVAIDDPDAEGLVDLESWTSNQRIPEVLELLEQSAEWGLAATIPYGRFHLRLYARKPLGAVR